jgi:hypothetical protein
MGQIRAACVSGQSHPVQLRRHNPHTEIERCKIDYSTHGPYDMLQAKFDDGDISPILANYEYFWHEEDQCWYRFDDIMMFDDEIA